MHVQGPSLEKDKSSHITWESTSDECVINDLTPKYKEPTIACEIKTDDCVVNEFYTAVSRSVSSCGQLSESVCPKPTASANLPRTNEVSISSDSLRSTHAAVAESAPTAGAERIECDFLQSLKTFRLSNVKNLIVAHLNVNGIRNKFVDIVQILNENTIDVLFISETKIDQSFTTAQFNIPNFRCLRSDRNAHGGGILVYIRSDLAFRRRDDIEGQVLGPVESLIVEFVVRQEKWLFSCLYSPHNKHKSACCSSIERIFDYIQNEQITTKFVLGDMNINLLSA